jgi:deazaflavin-dependent oxidoreductase (nitroreductase family)
MNAETIKRLEPRLQQGFRHVNRFMVLIWRLGLGEWVNAWPKVGGRILVISHRGRKTGKLRRTPVNYALVDGEIYCTAGFGAKSDWYRNLMANPHAQVWLPNGWWKVQAEEVQEPELRLKILRQVLIASGFASFAAGINPYKLEDEALAKLTEEYRLIRLRRIAPCTGCGGPGDLAWVWPVAVFLLLPVLIGLRLWQRRKNI